MMQICKCGKEFLTEADPYAIIPKSSGYEVNCGCFFDKKLKAALKWALDEIGTYDCCGNADYEKMDTIRKEFDLC